MAWPADEVIEVKCNYFVNGQKCMNVLHYKASGNSVGFLPEDMTAGLLALLDAPGNGTLRGEFAKVFGNNVTITQTTVQGIWPTRYALQIGDQESVGTIASPCEAQNVQGAITKRGLLGNRHNQGGVHVGGMPNSQFDNGLLTPAHKALLQALVDNFLAAEQTDGLSPVVYIPAILNRTKVIGPDGKPHYEITGSTLIDSWEVQDELRTQRTRTVGRGI